MLKAGTNYAGMSTEQRLTLLENLYVGYPRLKKLLGMIEECQRHSKGAAEPECMLIVGDTGVGKTTARERHALKYPPRVKQKVLNGVLQEVTVRPVLQATIPAAATTKSLATALLHAVGDPLSGRGTGSDITYRLYQAVRDCDVELVVLDELQHFMDANSKKLLLNTANWLKNFIGETRVPVVLIGMPSSEQILKADDQINRRFEMVVTLEPFGWDTTKQRDEFTKLMLMIDEELPLDEYSDLSSPERAFQIYQATGGVFSYVMKLLRRATTLAVRRGENKLSAALLAEAYEDRLARRVPGNPNPFGAVPPRPVARKAPPTAPSARAVNSHVKPKASVPTADDVLSQG